MAINARVLSLKRVHFSKWVWYVQWGCRKSLSNVCPLALAKLMAIRESFERQWDNERLSSCKWKNDDDACQYVTEKRKELNCYLTYLLIILVLLVVVVRLKSQLWATGGAFEAAMVVEGKVLERTNLLRRVDQVIAPIAGVLVRRRRKASSWRRLDGRRHCHFLSRWLAYCLVDTQTLECIENT